MSTACPSIWTIGHSNRPLDVFLEMLVAHEIRGLADVRRFPGSRRNPHFGRDQLPHHLERRGIAYRHWEALGGRRTQRPADSPNNGWRVAAFNAYADHMLTPGFQVALEELADWARQRSTCILCAEVLPERCHRRLIADALVARGWIVLHIVGSGAARQHNLTSFARVDGGRLTYPPEE